ncbi:hypothetical protein GUJ93_ZPchr0009g1598 [Zizania palustris]|uniref:Uncharacterized protein n=1 Tax=Zizania palustris TaxID=103762 RepID=A0A8J5RPX9_ZIZPA|nr:hypothetical protein GUJ93_ZPchr0009g1598 [Zizania palustris]
MVSWPEHASFMHGKPHEDGVLLELSRKGNLISGPSWLHLDGGQWLKKSSSSQDVACWLAPWCPTTDTTNKSATRASSLILVPRSKGDGDEDGGRQTIYFNLPRHDGDIYLPVVAGQNQQCPPFSCGDLHDISYPFRLQGDSRDCGVGPRPWIQTAAAPFLTRISFLS